ncbi:FMRFamide neuropeptides-like [Argopecten irradians]|uniref:FMRFamide neuropeptides-like n=1 Tax=Argopecten irradians TaxID=31199 RepID=UPI003710341F
MDTKAMVICGAALFLAIIDLAFTDDGKLVDSDQSEIKKRMAPDIEYEGYNPYSDLSDEDLAEIIKRGSLLRFGKRGSLLRFGKRGSLLRFGKRRSILRYGKRFDDQDENMELPLEDYADAGSDDKRGTLFRFGKRRALFRYGRSADKPHTPFRFGREEEYLEK